MTAVPSKITSVGEIYPSDCLTVYRGSMCLDVCPFVKSNIKLMADCQPPATKGWRLGWWEVGRVTRMCLCKHVKHLSVLCSFTAVISAHPIHSLDNPHHHFHSSSLASPARSHLYHPSSPWPIGTSMSLSDRANSTGERWGSSPDVGSIPGVGKWKWGRTCLLTSFSVSCLL